MRVHHLNCGTIPVPGGRLVSGTGPLLARANLVCHCLLIETDAGLVLVDSGFGTADVRNPRATLGRQFTMTGLAPRQEQTAIDQVQRLGYAPSDVRHIVLTHLDLDHDGGISDFPHATVHVHDTELRAARSPATRGERSRYRRQHWTHGPHWATYESTSGEHWFGFDAVRQLDGLPPQILLIPLPGHSRGHSGVAVDLGADAHAGADAAPRWLLHAGDAYFFHGELEAVPRVPPVLRITQSMLQTSGPDRHRNQRRLRELVRDHGDQVRVCSAHDPVELHAGRSPAAQ